MQSGESVKVLQSACIPLKTHASPLPSPPPTHLPHMHISLYLNSPHTHTLTQLTGSRGRPEDISIFLPTNCGTILTPATLPPCTKTSSTLVPRVRETMSYTRTPSWIPSPSGYFWSVTGFFAHSSHLSLLFLTTPLSSPASLPSPLPLLCSLT